MTAVERSNTMDVDALVAIDVHTHVHRSARGAEHTAEGSGSIEALGEYFGHGGMPTYTVPELAAYYRERDMGAVVFGVDGYTTSGEEPVPSRHKYVGSVASLGLHKGVAQVYGVKLKGWPAWFMHRTYHVSRVPTFNRKARVVADWTLASLFRREVVSLGQLQDPRREFVFTANTGKPGQLPPPKPAPGAAPRSAAEA